MAKSESPVGRLSHDSAFIVEFQHPPLRQAPRGVVLMRPGSLADFEWLMADFFLETLWLIVGGSMVIVE